MTVAMTLHLKFYRHAPPHSHLFMIHEAFWVLYQASAGGAVPFLKWSEIGESRRGGNQEQKAPREKIAVWTGAPHALTLQAGPASGFPSIEPK